MFFRATYFNQDLSSWNVSNVPKMGGKFGETYAFNNASISNCDVSHHVTNMNWM
jgi:surface protein